MPTPITITVSGEREGEFFVAVSPQFPGVKWVGESDEEAYGFFWDFVHERLGTSGAAEALKEHPLWPTIQEWCATSYEPPIPWLPRHEFQAELESLGFDPYQNFCIWQTYCETEILRQALVGGKYDAIAHEMLYKAAGHDLGRALCFAAGAALRGGPKQQEEIDKENKKRMAKGEPLLPASEVFADFAASTRHIEIVTALEAWMRRPGILDNVPIDGKLTPWLCKLSDSGTDETAAAFVTSTLARSIGTKTLRIAQRNAEDNAKRGAANLKKRRDEGKKEQKPAEFRKQVERWWVPAALWCKSDAGIVSAITPERRDNMTDAYDRVRKDISALGFTGSRLKHR